METATKNGVISNGALLNETAPKNRFPETVCELVCLLAFLTDITEYGVLSPSLATVLEMLVGIS